MSSSVLLRSVLRICPEVADAVSSLRPVVALESTIVAHGMPYPQNLKVAREVSSILRSKGVVPATVAIKDGVCRVGLTDEELSDLARTGKAAAKCSTRDLPLVMAAAAKLYVASNSTESVGGTGEDGGEGGVEEEIGRSGVLSSSPRHPSLWGATTVASTMHLAHLAGISTFVTGGTGGVHRGGELSLDVSADLPQLAKTPVVVVSAGIKSILDIRRTLEYLETLGVPTAAFGSDEFPAFFSPHSGAEAPNRVDSGEEVAQAYWAARDLDLSHGMLVAVPNSEPAGDAVEYAIQKALRDAKARGIEGRNITPYVLQLVAEQTKGKSLDSNISLVKRNAEVGAQVAIAISEEARRRRDQRVDPKKLTRCGDNIHRAPPKTLGTSDVVVIGGTVLDLVARPSDGQGLILTTSNPGICTESDGGVGRNVAEVLGQHGWSPRFYSAVGNDGRGRGLVRRLEIDCGVPGDNVRMVDNARTATYLAVLGGNGDLHAAIADMSVLSEIPIPTADELEYCKILVVDANPPIRKLEAVASAATNAGVKVLFEPTSVPKAHIAGASKKFLSCLTYACPNVEELIAIDAGLAGRATASSSSAALTDGIEIKEVAERIIRNMQQECAYLVVTLGGGGVLLASRVGTNTTSFCRFPAESNVSVRNCTGAGDTLCGAFVNALLCGENTEEAVKQGIKAAAKSLSCTGRAISPHLVDR